jgi:hypothetical protein
MTATVASAALRVAVAAVCGTGCVPPAAELSCFVIVGLEVGIEVSGHMSKDDARTGSRHRRRERTGVCASG